MKKGGENFTIKDKPKTKRPNPPKGQSNWDKEFEDYMYIDNEYGDPRLETWRLLGEIFENYLNISENLKIIKIKCKDGCIQIERIK